MRCNHLPWSFSCLLCSETGAPLLNTYLNKSSTVLAMTNHFRKQSRILRCLITLKLPNKLLSPVDDEFLANLRVIRELSRQLTCITPNRLRSLFDSILPVTQVFKINLQLASLLVRKSLYPKRPSFQRTVSTRRQASVV